MRILVGIILLLFAGLSTLFLLMHTELKARVTAIEEHLWEKFGELP